MEWLYTGSIQSPNSRLSHVALRSSIESHISLHILAEEYKIKDLADSAMDYIGICYSLMGALPSKAEIHHALNKSPISSRLREYMSNSFLHILSAPSYTTEVGDVHSTGELWLLAKTHDDLGEYAFGYLRDGDTNRSPPKYDFLCDYRSHSKNSSCAVRGKLFIHYVESNHDEPLSVSSSPLTFSTPRDSLIEPLERRAPNEQNGFKDVIPLQAFIAASTSASIGTITTPNASANESKIATPSASRPQNTNAIGRIYTPSSGKHPRPAIESLAAEMQVWK